MSMWRSVVVPSAAVVVVVVRRDVQAHVVRVDRRRQDRHRDLDLEVVAAARVGVVDGRLVAADPRRARLHLDARRVRRVAHRVGERAGRVALVVVGVARPARPVGPVAVGVLRVVRVREDPELERGGGVAVGLRRGAARVDQQLDRVGLPVRDALHRRHRVALEVVGDVDEEVQVVAAAGDLRDVAASQCDAGRGALRALPALAHVQRGAAVLARALGPVDLRRGAPPRGSSWSGRATSSASPSRAGGRAVGGADRDRAVGDRRAATCRCS